MSDVPSLLQYIQIEAGTFKRPVSESQLQSQAGSINGLLDFRSAQIALDSTYVSEILHIIDCIKPPGTVMASMLTEAEFNGQAALVQGGVSQWVTADGRDVTGSRYHTITGRDHVPDLRGYFIRGKDQGSGQNPDGDLALGTLQMDAFRYHTHDATATSTVSPNFHPYPGFNGPPSTSLDGTNGTKDVQAGDKKKGTDPQRGRDFLNLLHGSLHTTVVVDAFGTSETKAINITINWFIRVN